MTGAHKSPLPDMHRTENGDSVMMARQKVEELEEQQRKLMDRVNLKNPFRTAKPLNSDKPEENRKNQGSDSVDSNQAIARAAAEIAQTIEEQNKRPRKTFITPSTKAVAMPSITKLCRKNRRYWYFELSTKGR